MLRKRWPWLILGMFLILFGAIGWVGYRAMHKSELNHELIVAATAGEPEPVRILLDQGANPNTYEDVETGTEWRRFYNLLLPQTYYEQRCPLRQALMNGHLDTNRLAAVQILLEHKANPNIGQKSDRPLSLRALYDVPNDRLLTLFLQHGADPNTIDGSGNSMLMYAVDSGEESWVRAVLDHGGRPNLANTSGDSPLMWAAYQQNTKIVALLLAHGANVNHTNQRGLTALTYALAGSGHAQHKTLEMLIAAGADVNLPDVQGCSPFLLALTMHSPESRFLLAQGGDVHTAISAVRMQSISVEIKTVISTTPILKNISIESGKTPLMLAARARDIEIVRSILAKGPDVTVRDAQGKTALDYAKAAPEIRALLLQAGARP